MAQFDSSEPCKSKQCLLLLAQHGSGKPRANFKVRGVCSVTAIATPVYISFLAALGQLARL